MFKADDYRLKIKDLEETLGEAKYALDIDNRYEQLKKLRAEQEDPAVWQDLERSAGIGREISSIENKIASYEKGRKALDDANEIIDLIEETEEEELVSELDKMIVTAEADIEEMRVRALLRGKYDNSNALLSIHAGAGGTEACDWCSMLYRMYCRYAEMKASRRPSSTVLRATARGSNRWISRSKGKTHTATLKRRSACTDSCVSRRSMPTSAEVDDDNEIEIKDEDIRIDVYRSSGAGGQKVNKTETAIRITHFPTGIVVTCQNERSQLQNKEMAFKYLRSKLLEKQIEERLAQEAALKGETKKIEWGSQIRSYVFCPYTLVKDHRTGYEMGDVQAVMDGNIQGFIIDYLKKT